MSEVPTVSALPPHPDLVQYRTQARELLRAYRRGDETARRRFTQFHPRSSTAGFTAKLADAQFVISREHGYQSWPKFKQAIELARDTTAGIADAFVLAAIHNRLDDARAALAASPHLTASSIAAAAAYGDVRALSRFLKERPECVSQTCGPRNRLPILYASESAFITDPDRKPFLLDTMKLFLAAGADPNSTYREEPYKDFPIPPLCGAAGRYNDLEMATLLLDAGALVNDNESLYHSVEHRDHRCTRLLLERSADVNTGNVLAHQLDYEDIDGVRLLLDYGADPNVESPFGGNMLHWAVNRHRSSDVVRLLLEHGADPRTRMADGTTAYRMAVRFGHADLAELLRTPESVADLGDIDLYVGAAAAGDFRTMEAMRSADPGLIGRLSVIDHGVVSRAIESSEIALAGNLLAAGFSANGRGPLNATPLHWAAWYGLPDAIALLLDHGADINATGADLGSTPIQWALHGSGNAPAPDDTRYFAVIDALLAAGATIDPVGFEMCSEGVRRRYTAQSAA